MHLRRTEGTVAVANDQGKDLQPKENLGLYSGYQVGTQAESYAWIDLDSVKLTKLDQDSEIVITQEGKQLEIEVRSGSLFFNVTEPLAEDETLNIRSSTMMIGIRGTCGWVRVDRPDEMAVYLLDGTVECTVTEESGRYTTASVSAGEMARMSLSPEGAGQITVEEFPIYAVPDFVLGEVTEDQALCEKIEDQSGLVLQGWDPEAAFVQSLEAVGYIGDAAACAMTAEHRAAFAQTLRQEIEAVETNFTPYAYTDSYVQSSRPVCFAGLVDLGGGNPALLFGSAMEISGSYGTELWYTGGGTVWGIFEYIDGQVVKREPDRTAVYGDYLLTGGHYVADPGYSAEVYVFENGRIPASPTTRAMEDYGWDWNMENGTYTVDGRPADQAAVDAWRARWDRRESALAGYDHGSDVACSFWGLADAKSVLSVLEGYGPLIEGESQERQEEGPSRTVSAFDPATGIQRTTLDTTGYPLEIFYEIPVFDQEGEGYQRINAFFQEKRDAFLGDTETIDGEKELSLTANPYNETFYDNWYASVPAHTGKLVSVVQSQEYHMGGPHPWTGLETHTFRTDTGEELSLGDVADGTASEISTAILADAQRQDPNGDFIDFETLRGRRVEEFHFYVRDGKVYVIFDMYECTLFRAMIEEIELPMGVKSELR